jgi:hypothetical protein
MRRDVAYEYFMGIVVNRCHEPPVVPTDIENNEAPHGICTGKGHQEIIEGAESSVLYNPVPSFEGRAGVRVNPAELLYLLSADDMH